MTFGRFHLLAAVVVIGFLSGSAQADFVFDFVRTDQGTPVTVNPAVPIVLLPNNTITLELYIRERGTTILQAERLFATGFNVTYDTPPGSGNPSNVVRVTQATKSPQLNFALSAPPEITPSRTRVQQVATTGIAGSVPPDQFNRVFLGTFTFLGVAPNAVPVQVTVTDFDPDPGHQDFITGRTPLPTVLDTQLQPSSIQFLVPVPEPTSLALVGMFASSVVAAVVRRRRSSRAKGPEDLAPPSLN